MSPAALGWTVSAAGAGCPKVAAYIAVIKTGMEGACEATAPAHTLPPHPPRSLSLYL